MTFPGIRYARPPATEPPLPLRADIAAFVGLVARRDGSASRQPVTLTSPGQFDAVFLGDRRPLRSDGQGFLPTAMALAVRSFFAEGGRRCVVVPCGDPLPLLTRAPDAVRDALGEIVPPPEHARPDAPESWRGLGHVHGLSEAAMVACPDLVDLVAGVPEPEAPDPPRHAPEVFRPADQPLPQLAAIPGKRPAVTAPRLATGEAAAWGAKIDAALALLARASGGGRRKDLTLIAAAPLPRDAAAAAAVAAEIARERAGGEALAFAFPWLGTSRSIVLPEGVESPEGAFAGLLARSALERGAFRSAAGQALRGVNRLVPALDAAALRGRSFAEACAAPAAGAAPGEDWIGDAACVIARTADGVALVADRMADGGSGSVRRLVGVLLRAARLAGEDLVFEPNGEGAWTRLRRRIEEAMLTLWRLRAFDGATPGEAFSVACGRSTMTQADIDAGRLVARVSFTAAEPVERITVTLAMQDGALSLGRAA